MSEKKIIGYKLVKTEYMSAVMSIRGTIGEMGVLGFAMMPLMEEAIYYDADRVGIERLKKAGVLDLWFEPIYKKQDKPTFTEWVLQKRSRDYCYKDFKEVDERVFDYIIDVYGDDLINFKVPKSIFTEENRGLLLNKFKNSCACGKSLSQCAKSDFCK
jgi:hypothetical protein